MFTSSNKKSHYLNTQILQLQITKYIQTVHSILREVQQQYEAHPEIVIEREIKVHYLLLKIMDKAALIEQ